MIIKGTYKFKQKNKTIHKGENLITLLGESFFLNRWINDNFTPINSIVLGKGTSRPLKTDLKLGKQTIKKPCTSKADIQKKTITLTIDTTADEILGTSEIGVTNEDTLISHDVYEPITTQLLEEDTTSKIHIEYTFHIATGGIRRGWKPSNNHTGLYYIYEPSTVTGVHESTTGNGYTRKNNEELEPGQYYYNTDSKNLYIKPLNGKNPDNLELIIMTR